VIGALRMAWFKAPPTHALRIERDDQGGAAEDGLRLIQLYGSR
jgi:hypothetical protein